MRQRRQWPPGSAGFMGTKAWRDMVQRVIDRDGGLCQIRLPGCTATATSADHWPIPRGSGGPDDPSNLRACCTHCNGSSPGRKAAQPTAASNGHKMTQTLIDQQIAIAKQQGRWYIFAPPGQLFPD
jgi:hypothetical protein